MRFLSMVVCIILIAMLFPCGYSDTVIANVADVRLFNTDTMTKGNWNGVYGNSGYVIFFGNTEAASGSAGAVSNHIKKKAPKAWYSLTASTSSLSGTVHGNPSSDERALVMPGSTIRKAITVSSNITLGADITISDGVYYYVSFYMPVFTTSIETTHSRRLTIKDSGGNIITQKPIFISQSPYITVLANSSFTFEMEEIFGPDMFYEFMLQYQIPILEKFGIVAYGCCEDLTQKIDYLRKIPNLRRIAVTPFADLEKCAQQIRDEYILSWRPNPSEMIATGLNEEYVREFMRKNLKILKEYNCHFDITLKDVETVSNQPENVSKWVRIVREEIIRNM